MDTEKKYVVGIDFGHGETSAAYCSLKDGLSKVKDIEIQHNGETIPSAIFMPKDSRKPEKIGISAFNQDNVGKGTVYVGFKQKPQKNKMDMNKFTAWCHFMKLVLSEIQGNHPELPFHSDDFELYIAKPSSWKTKVENNYYEYTTAPEYAGLPLASERAIVNESRAAFVSAQRSENAKKIGMNIYKGTVVIDMGSSTVDMTYLSNIPYPNKTHSGYYMKDGGYYCGASIIEEAILKDEEEKNVNLRSLLKENDLRYPLLYKIRTVKERYFTNKKPIIETLYFDQYKTTVSGTMVININDETIDRYTGEYKQKFKEALSDYVEYLKKELGGKPEIYYVILTGGASRMYFAKNIVCESWNLSENSIHSINNPSLTVSRGIAEVARMDYLTRGKKEEIDKLIKERLTPSSIRAKVAPKFITNVVRLLSEKCLSRVNDCKSTFYVLSEDIQRICNGTLQNNQIILEELYNAIDEHGKIHNEIEKVVSYYSDLGINRSFLMKPLDISNLEKVVLQSKGIPEIFEKMQEEVGSEMERLNQTFFDKVKKIIQVLFESKSNRKIREQQEKLANRRKGGEENLTTKHKALLSEKLKVFFNALPDKLADVLCDPGFINNLEKCSNQYMYGLLNNIDQVRKEITENE